VVKDGCFSYVQTAERDKGYGAVPSGPPLSTSGPSTLLISSW